MDAILCKFLIAFDQITLHHVQHTAHGHSLVPGQLFVLGGDVGSRPVAIGNWRLVGIRTFGVGSSFDNSRRRGNLTLVSVSVAVFGRLRTFRNQFVVVDLYVHSLDRRDHHYVFPGVHDGLARLGCVQQRENCVVG